MKKTDTQKEEIVNGFKGFDKDLKCRAGEKNEQQYSIGEEYVHEGKVEACKSGYHFCENPLDIFNYYPAGSSRFTTVEGSGQISRENSDSKVAVSKLKIGVELSIQSLIESGVKFIFERTTLTKEKTNTEEKLQASNSGYRGAASNSGDSGAASNSGDSGAASNSGDSGAASNSGDSGAASNSGYRGAASNSGYSGAASNSGDSGAASNSGDSGAASNSGYRGAASNSGDSGAASNSGDSGAASNSGDSGAASNSGYRGAASNSGYRGAASNSGDSGAAFTIGSYSSAETNAGKSVAVAVGYENKARGGVGSWLVVAERNDDFEILAIVSKKVDGKKIKENVFYKVLDGKLIEA